MSHTTPMTVRWRVRDILAQRARDGDPMSISELTRRSGLTYPTVHAIATGDGPKRVDITTLDGLCRALCVGTGDLLEYVADDA